MIVSLKFKTSAFSLSALLVSLFPGSHAFAQGAAARNGNYAASARSMASVSTTLDSVVGSRPSRIAQQFEQGSETLTVQPNGVILNKQGQVITPGCPAVPIMAARQHNPGGAPAEPQLKDTSGNKATHQKPESVRLGLVQVHTGGSMQKQILMDASFAPSGLYVAPRACQRGAVPDAAQIRNAAGSLATADGNPFALAGNRENIAQATQGHADGSDIVLEAGATGQ